MRRRRLPALVPALATATATAVLALAPAAWSAPQVPADKPQVLSRWTQTGVASYQEWAEAREHRAAWAAYGFDWSTDHCTSSPDNPSASPSRTPARATTSATATTVRRGCSRPPRPGWTSRSTRTSSGSAHYSGSRRSSCEGTAWTYYQAVRLLGIS